MNAPSLDITAGRHGGNAESICAHQSVLPFKEKTRRMVVDALLQADAALGLTCKEITQFFAAQYRAGALPVHVPYTTVSARLSELKADGVVIGLGIRREGAQALVLATAVTQ